MAFGQLLAGKGWSEVRVPLADHRQRLLAYGRRNGSGLVLSKAKEASAKGLEEGRHVELGGLKSPV